MGTRCFGGAGPPAPKHPLMLRACGLVWFRRGGRLLIPPPFLTCRAVCSDKGLVWIWGEPHAFFFKFWHGNPYQTQRAWCGWEG
ncbi:unnamed protein product, partial [Staurois parvus]